MGQTCVSFLTLLQRLEFISGVNSTGGFFSKNIFMGFVPGPILKTQYCVKLKTCQVYDHESHIITSFQQRMPRITLERFFGASFRADLWYFTWILHACVFMQAHRCRQIPSSARLGHSGLSCGRGPCTGWREPSPAWLGANQRAMTGDSHSGGCWSADAWDRWRKRWVIVCETLFWIVRFLQAKVEPSHISWVRANVWVCIQMGSISHRAYTPGRAHEAATLSHTNTQSNILSSHFPKVCDNMTPFRGRTHSAKSQPVQRDR